MADLDFRAVVLLLLLLSGLSCMRSEPPDSRTVFRFNQHNPVTSLDPAFARSQNNIWAVEALFDGLLQLDDSLRIQPSLARAWAVSPDGRTYRFLLRTDAFFHDDPCFPEGRGRALRASDVVFSFERLLDDAWPKPGSWIFKGRVDEHRPFEAESDSVFVLRLREPFLPMLYILTMPYALIVPPEALAHYGRAFRQHPVGTGPFRFKAWAEDHALVLLRNPLYFESDRSGRRLPYLDAIRMSFINDRKTAYLEFRKGRLDMLWGIESSYAAELLTAEGALQPALREQFTFRKQPYLNTEYFGIRMGEQGHPALSDRLVREALNLGFDRQAMLRTLRRNIGRPADSGFAPAGLPTFDPIGVPGYTYDPEKATALLARAGYPSGRGLPELTLLCNADYQDMAVFISRQWEDLGIRCRVELLETAVLRERMRQGQASFFRASWIADYPDAESYYACFYSRHGAPPNYTGFSDAGFDRLYEASLRETDPGRRGALYRSMERILITEAPVIPLFYDETAVFTRQDIAHFPAGALGSLRLKHVLKAPSVRGIDLQQGVRGL
jgi:peptide/nickel transport system substrate-binding protein